MSRTVWISGILAVLLVAGVALVWRYDQPAASLAIDAGDQALVAQGRRVYEDSCAACHGLDLQGQENWQQRRSDGRMPAPPHDASGHTWHHPDPVLFLITKKGPAALAGEDYRSDMSAFEGVLSDEDIIASLAYIKSRWPGEIRDRHDAISNKTN